MPNEEQVRESLDRIPVPGVMRSLVKMNLVREVRIADQKVDVTLASAALSLENQEWLKDKTSDVIQKLEGVEEASVSFVDSKPKDINEIRHVIAIMSGKGGVGKSLVASLTAIALKRQGYEVGILDADITGPSIPKMFGINTRPAGSDSGILPVSSRSGIELMSINLLLPSEDDAVIWRGPLIGKAITQFWEETLWGKLDYLVVDLPPGTADAPLTVMQTLPLTGIIIVFTPQALTTMVVRKAINMARQMSKPILGVVENMSYLYMPEIDRKIELFGKSRGEEMAKAAHAPLLGQLPIDPALAKLCDEGNIERYDAEIIAKLGESLSQVTLAKTSSGSDRHD
ncbi:MAG TPA: Mrp/NBP35 family ATP-binding protein [Dehalococcoidia bacterium]|nr:Mrp/NBP35 family ATP-binding protein [Dehalococcoidia bacterium]